MKDFTMNPRIRIECGGRPIRYKTFKFSGGETQVRILDGILEGPVVFTAFPRNGEDIMELLMLANAARYLSYGPLELVCPYFPYARQDRACAPGEAFGAQVMARILEPAFDSFVFWDIHSRVSLDLFKGKARSLDAAQFISPYILPGEIVVAPDKGALHRAETSAERAAGYHPILVMEKVRNPEDGHISGVAIQSVVPENYRDAPAIIVDDICDGGRTFIGAGRALRDALTGPLRLYVTHGIFSNGFDELLEVFDEILVANLMCSRDALPEKIRIIAP